MATDLVNTSADVRSAGEILADPAALAAFLNDHDVRLEALVDDTMPMEEDPAEVHTLRHDIRSILELDSTDETADRANAVARPFLRAAPRWRWWMSTSGCTSSKGGAGGG